MTDQQNVEKLREDVPPKEVQIVMICIPVGNKRWLLEKPWDGVTAGHTHYIVQKSMEDASIALTEWFRTNGLEKVNKIVFDVHGSPGAILVRDTKKEISIIDPVTEKHYTTNIGTAFMDVAQFYNQSTETMARDVSGLKIYLKK